MIAELCSGLCAVCEGSLHDKLVFIFDVCDYNNSKGLNYDDFLMMLFAVFSGIARMAKQPCPSEYALEKLVDEAFASLEMNAGTDTMRKGTRHIMY
jgi:hypothetical protein